MEATTTTSIEIIHGDCLEIMPSLGKFDFTFADPPFNIGHEYRGFEDKKSEPEYNTFTQQWIEQCWLQCNGVMALHGPDKLAERYVLSSHALGFANRRIAWINWHYRFGQCHRSNWIDARCHCLIYSSVDKHTWNPESVLVQSDRVKYGDKRVKETANGGRRLPGTVWGIPSDGKYFGRVQGNSKERWNGHPNQLPLKYIYRLLLAYTNPGDRVLIPFCGSGTEALACQALNRICVAIDISEENVVSARRRLVEQKDLAIERLKTI